jgi:hypothetical protein
LSLSVGRVLVRDIEGAAKQRHDLERRVPSVIDDISPLLVLLVEVAERVVTGLLEQRYRQQAAHAEARERLVGRLRSVLGRRGVKHARRVVVAQVSIGCCGSFSSLSNQRPERTPCTDLYSYSGP